MAHCKVHPNFASLRMKTYFIKQKMSQVRCRGFVFTKNNYTEDDVDCLKVYGEANDNCYIIFSKEVAPTTGTPHLQGYVHFKNPRFMKPLINLGIFGHMALARGTAAQNIAYVLVGAFFCDFT